MPVVHVPLLYQAAAMYPMEGVQVDPQPATSLTVSGVIGPPADTFAMKKPASDAYLTGPTLPAGMSAITVELDAAFDTGTGAIELIEYVSTTF